MTNNPPQATAASSQKMASTFLHPMPATAGASIARRSNPLDGLRRWRPCVVTAAAATGGNERGPADLFTRRQGFFALATASLVAVAPRLPDAAAILEQDDDLELLERVKRDKKRRIERQELISSSVKETGYLQELVYRLDIVGQAIEKNDLSAASAVLGLDVNADWVKNTNAAFTKLTSTPEEKKEVDAFNSSLMSLISSVGREDIESSKLAFVSSASALEKWVTETGLNGQLKGL